VEKYFVSLKYYLMTEKTKKYKRKLYISFRNIYRVKSDT